MPDRLRKAKAESGQPAKSCAACGRTMTWRKSWARNWDEVKFCSDACRARRIGPVDGQLERTILELLAKRGAGKTICPSEAARAVAGSEDRAAWEGLMEPARAAARRLVAEGRLEVLQGGHAVDASTQKGRSVCGYVEMRFGGGVARWRPGGSKLRMAIAKKSASKKSAGKKAAAKKKTLLKEKRSTGEGPACWPGYERVSGTEAGAKGSCEPKPDQTAGEKKADARVAAGSKLRKAGGNKAKANRS